MKKHLFALVGATVFLYAGSALAQQAQSGPLQTQLEARKVAVAADGKETLQPADNARPGDVIEYTATYRNTARQTLRNVEATLPIPANTEYLPGSARPAAVKASADGRAFAEPPLKRRVMQNGKETEVEVPYREYRYLRWFPGELGGEKAVAFTARVRVLDDRAPGVGSKGGGK